MDHHHAFHALPTIDKLLGIENWASWKLLILANARALKLTKHITGTAQPPPTLPPLRKTHLHAEHHARILILNSISPLLFTRLCELGLQDNTPAADLMAMLEAAMAQEPDAAAHDSLARLLRISRAAYPSMGEYGKDALAAWSHVRRYWPTTADLVAVMAILEGMKAWNEPSYSGWKRFVHNRKGKVSSQDVVDLVSTLRDRRTEEDEPSSIYPQLDESVEESYAKG